MGIGAVLIDGITVGASSVIGGSLVSKDVPDHATVGGSPARAIQRQTSAP